jgi:hypothetical protein
MEGCDGALICSRSLTHGYAGGWCVYVAVPQIASFARAMPRVLLYGGSSSGVLEPCARFACAFAETIKESGNMLSLLKRWPMEAQTNE